MATSMKAQKNELRKRMKEKLKRMTEENIRVQSDAVTSQVLALPEYQNARSISIFLSMPGKELSTTKIVMEALTQDKKVFIPYIHKDSQSDLKIMSMLRLDSEADFQSLTPDAWGIPSLLAQDVSRRENALGGKGPSSDARGIPSLDLVFMPAMAFDTANRRLGHGKGFYDRYLTLVNQAAHVAHLNSPALVGLALREQLLPEGEIIPTTEEDWRADKVLVAANA